MKIGNKKIDADVLIIPAADILLLAVFFLVVSGSMIYTPAIRIQIPELKAAELVSADSPVVTLTPGGGIFLNGRKVSKEGLAMILELSSELSQKKGVDSVLIIRADQRVEYNQLLEIFILAEESGIESVALAARTR